MQHEEVPVEISFTSTPISTQQNALKRWPKQLCKPHRTPTHSNFSTSSIRRRLDITFPCRTRSGMSCAVDTAWQKKGYDSLTSHTFFMSKAKYGKKVVKTIVSHRTCGTCNWWRRNKPSLPVRAHKCVRNHSGSARLMEAVSGVKGVAELAAEGTPVEYIEGDGDNTLIARLKNNMNIDMKKRYDRNHVVKNVGKRLYALQSNKDVKLSKTVIIHLEKCLKYCFARNQGDSEALRENLKALVPHQFGDHSFCNERFCALKRKPDEIYVHKSLPYKRSLTGDILREKLNQIFDPLIVNAKQYSDLGSSQQCEHANKEVALRAPKSHHYGSTKSLDYRVHATSAFINEGRNYIVETNKNLGLSPGAHTVSYAHKCLKHRLEQQQRQSQPSVKRRRLILKQERATNQGALEALEGASYQSGVGHSAYADIESLPEAIPHGNFKPVQVKNGTPTFITIDLETTDLIRGTVMPHITQVAAKEVKGDAAFSVYVNPKTPISFEAERVTGICTNNNGEMFLNGKPVKSLSIHSATSQLCDWLDNFSNVFLVAHNGRKFDYPVLMKALENNNQIDLFMNVVTGLVDSLPVFKKMFPGESHKQVDLVQRHLSISYDAHNAQADVEALASLLNLCEPNDLVKCSFSPLAQKYSLMFNQAKAKNVRSLDPLISNGVCKRPTAENIAGSGLNMDHLSVIFRRSGEDGLTDTFTAKNKDGFPRVTNVKKILDEVIPKLGQFLESL